MSDALKRLPNAVSRRRVFPPPEAGERGPSTNAIRVRVTRLPRGSPVREFRRTLLDSRRRQPVGHRGDEFAHLRDDERSRVGFAAP